MSEIKRWYFAGHAFPEPISGGGKQDGYIAYSDHTAALAAKDKEIEALKQQRAIFMRGLEAEEKETGELKDRIAELEAKLARLSAPVTDEEWDEANTMPMAGVAWRREVDAIIAARAAKETA